MLRRIWLFLSLSLLSASAVLAQTRGTIFGHVSDTTGAVVPKVTITLTNTGTEHDTHHRSRPAPATTHFPTFRRESITFKPPIRASRPTTAQNVELQVQQSLTQNFTLQVGEVTQTVTVEASAALLQTQNSTLGTVVPTQTLSQMPLNSRNYLSLVAVSANTNIALTDPRPGRRAGGRRPRQRGDLGGRLAHHVRPLHDRWHQQHRRGLQQLCGPALHRRHPGNEGANRRLSRPIRVQRDPGQRGHQERRQQVSRHRVLLPAQQLRGCTRVSTTPLSHSSPKGSPSNTTTTDSCSADRSRFPTSSTAKTASSSWSTTNGIPEPGVSNTAYLADRGRPGRRFQPVHHNSGRTRHSHLRSRHRERQWHGQDTVPGQCDPANRIDPTSALSSSSCSTTRLRHQPFHNNYTYPIPSKGRPRRLQRARRLLTSHRSCSRPSASAMAWKRTPLRASRRRAGPPAAISSPATTSTWAPTPGPSLPRSSTWPRLARLTSTNLSALFSQDKVNAVGLVNAGIPNLQPGIPATWGIPSVSFTPDPYPAIGDSTDGPYVTSRPRYLAQRQHHLGAWQAFHRFRFSVRPADL